MEELVARVGTALGVPAETADEAVRVVLRFLYADGPRETVERLAREMGAAEALADPSPAPGGLLARLGGLMGGGGAMAAFSALTAAGLEMDQIQRLVSTFIAYAREKVGDATVDEVIAGIPGLERRLAD
jgi:hypothetical protein